MIKSRWRRDYDMTGFPATGIAFRRIRQRSSICRFPATGIDLHFLFLLEKENNCSHQFLNWWQQVSTGHLHLDGFDSVFLTHKKRETLLRVSLFLVPATGIEPVRILLRGILSPLCLPIPPCRHRFVIVAQFSLFVKEKAVVIDYPGTFVPG